MIQYTSWRCNLPDYWQTDNVSDQKTNQPTCKKSRICTNPANYHFTVCHQFTRWKLSQTWTLSRLENWFNWLHVCRKHKKKVNHLSFFGKGIKQTKEKHSLLEREYGLLNALRNMAPRWTVFFKEELNPSPLSLARAR